MNKKTYDYNTSLPSLKLGLLLTHTYKFSYSNVYFSDTNVHFHFAHIYKYNVFNSFSLLLLRELSR